MNLRGKFYKYYKMISVLLVVSLFCGCAKKVTDGYTIVNGIMVKSDLVDSGIYFDLASLSESQLEDMIDRVVDMEKPKNIGEVIFTDEIENITITTTTPSQVTNQEIEAEIEKKRDKAQIERIVEEKRGCKIGDTIALELTMSVEGEEVESQKIENNEVVIGNGDLIEGLEDAIIGKKAGVNFDVDLVLPKDIEEESLRGKKANFKCFIKYIKEKVTPMFDDEFALTHSRKHATNAEAYREEIKEEIQKRNNNAVLEREKRELLNKLYKICVGTPSEEGFAWAFSKSLTEQKRLAKLTDKTVKEVMMGEQNTLLDALRLYRTQALYSLAEPMVLDALQKKYNITYTEDDKMKWFENLCIVNNYGSDVTYELYSNSMGEPYINDNARKDKILSEVLKLVKKEYVDIEEMEPQE